MSLARTAAFISNDTAPLSSRTVRFISGIHFPPGISGTANAPLYGIENTNRGCTLYTNLSGPTIPTAGSIDGTTTGLGITTGKADLYDGVPDAVNPGGVPLFRNGNSLAGGIGVAGVDADVAEFAGYSAALNEFKPNPAAPGVVVINGVALPFVIQTTQPAGVRAGSFTGSFYVGPSASPGPPTEGILVAPWRGRWEDLRRPTS